MTERVGGARRRTREEVKGGDNYEGSGGDVTVVLLQPLTLRKGDKISLSAVRGGEYAHLHVNERDIYLAPRRWQPGPLGWWYFDTEWEPWSPKFSDGRAWDESTLGWRVMRGWDVCLPRWRHITIFASKFDLMLVGAASLVTLIAITWLLM